jgi:hypothetical protein
MMGVLLVAAPMVSALLVAGGVPADDMKFFDSSSLSFEVPEQKSEAEAGAAAQKAPRSEAPPPPPPAPDASRAKQGASGDQVQPAGAVPGEEPGEEAPGAAPTVQVPLSSAVSRGRAGGANVPGAQVRSVPVGPLKSQGASVTASGAVQVTAVRKLRKEEREAMKGKLRCSNPLAADIRPDGRLRRVLSDVLQIPLDSLPERLFWVFARDGRCFDRAGQAFARELDEVDEQVRRGAPRAGGD